MNAVKYAGTKARTATIRERKATTVLTLSAHRLSTRGLSYSLAWQLLWLGFFL
jgi:hypothetical protein